MVLAVLRLVFCVVALPSLVFATPSKDAIVSNITNVTSGLAELALTLDPRLQNQKAVLSKFKINFANRLKEKFSTDELSKIDETLQKIGGQNIIKIAKVVLTEFTTILATGSVPDVTPSIPPRYDALLEKKMKEDKIDQKLRTAYASFLAIQPKGKAQDSVDEFVAKAKKHFKKTVADNFTEEQYSTYFTFESSSVGKRFFKLVEKSMLQTLLSQSLNNSLPSSLSPSSN
jgi:hypothetical protein